MFFGSNDKTKQIKAYDLKTWDASLCHCGRDYKLASSASSETRLEFTIVIQLKKQLNHVVVITL